MTQKQILSLLSILAIWLTLLIIFTQQPWNLLSQQDQINPSNILAYNSNLETTAIFDNQKIDIPKISDEPPIVLGDSSPSASKRIDVDLTAQRLYAYEDNRLVYSFLVSSGKWDRTPTGTFSIWAKVKSQKMSGGSKELGTYYYLPNVPYIMFFYNDKVAKSMGYSLHGTYWHNNFGTPMSHGCINMRTDDVKQLYYWANPQLGDKTSIKSSDDNPGTQITIYGKYQYPLSKR